MEFNRNTQTVKSFARDMKNGKYNMFHKLQRKEGQWKNYEKSPYWWLLFVYEKNGGITWQLIY